MKLGNVRCGLYVAVVALLLAVSCSFAQSPTQLKKKCPNVSTYSIVQITNLGDINVNPCSGRTVTITGAVVLPSSVISLANGSAASPSLKFANSLTTGVYRAGADIFGISTAGAANTTFSAAINTSRSAVHTFSDVAGTSNFSMTLTPLNNGGTFTVGQSTSSYLSLNQNTGTTLLSSGLAGNGIIINSRDTDTFIGDTSSVGNGTQISIEDASAAFQFNNTANTAILSTQGVNRHAYQRTVTAAGTTGAQTIDKPVGTLNIAAGQASIVLTNNTVNTSSIPFVTLRTADATCTFVKSAVPTANTLTITLNAACTAETSVGFFITN